MFEGAEHALGTELCGCTRISALLKARAGGEERGCPLRVVAASRSFSESSRSPTWSGTLG